jgi:hypothetical protein
MCHVSFQNETWREFLDWVMVAMVVTAVFAIGIRLTQMDYKTLPFSDIVYN